MSGTTNGDEARTADPNGMEGSPEAANEPSAVDATAEVAAEVAVWRERALRTQAEFENFKKRSRREQDEDRKYAEVGLLRDLLPVVDNLERAVGAAETNPDVAALLAGVRLVAQQLEQVFERHECRRVPNEGPFDPNVHAALAQEPSATVEAGHVVRTLQSGFRLHERVIRPAQVIVAAATG